MATEKKSTECDYFEQVATRGEVGHYVDYIEGKMCIIDKWINPTDYSYQVEDLKIMDRESERLIDSAGLSRTVKFDSRKFMDITDKRSEVMTALQKACEDLNSKSDTHFRHTVYGIDENNNNQFTRFHTEFKPVTNKYGDISKFGEFGEDGHFFLTEYSKTTNSDLKDDLIPDWRLRRFAFPPKYRTPGIITTLLENQGSTK